MQKLTKLMVALRAAEQRKDIKNSVRIALRIHQIIHRRLNGAKVTGGAK